MSNYAPKISKAEAALDWRRTATELARQVRAFNPFPMCHTRRADDEAPIRVWSASEQAQAPNAEPGTVLEVSDAGIAVACGEGQLLLQTLQLPGKKALPVTDLLRGRGDLFHVGETLALPESKA